MNSDDTNNNNRPSVIPQMGSGDSDDTKEHIKDVLNTAQIHLIVATLLVTVTFTAGFTLPGGFENNDDRPNKGMAILAKKAAFCTFVITDAIAFVCSAGAVFGYFIMAALYRPTTNEDLKMLRNVCTVASVLQLLSMLAVTIAFISGLYATLSHSVGLAATVCVIGSLSLPIYGYLFNLLIKNE